VKQKILQNFYRIHNISVSRLCIPYELHVFQSFLPDKAVTFEVGRELSDIEIIGSFSEENYFFYKVTSSDPHFFSSRIYSRSIFIPPRKTVSQP